MRRPPALPLGRRPLRGPLRGPLRRRVPGIRTLKTAVAAAGAYAAAVALTRDPQPVLAALTALLVVQLTLHDSLREGLRRVVAVVAGVLVAVGFSEVAGLSWWTIALVVALGIVVGRLLRVGPQLMEVPISAMLVLAVGGQGSYALDRVEETLIGALVGLTVHVLVAPPLYLQPVGQSLSEFAAAIADLLRRMSAALAEDDPDWERWYADARALGSRAVRVDTLLERAESSLRLNPRGRLVSSAQGSLRAAHTTLEHAAVAVRGITRTLPAVVASTGPGPARDRLGETLAAAAAAVTAFEAHAGSDPYAPTDDPAPLRDAVDRARERQQAAVTALAVDPAVDAGAWQVNGALLADLDRLLIELDPRADVAAAGVGRAGRLDPVGARTVRQAVAARRRRP